MCCDTSCAHIKLETKLYIQVPKYSQGNRITDTSHRFVTYYRTTMMVFMLRFRAKDIAHYKYVYYWLDQNALSLSSEAQHEAPQVGYD